MELKLYIAGQSLRSRAAQANLQRLLDAGHADYSLSVIDVLEQPGEAEAANIVAAPTLVKSSPPPVVRIVGDLSATAVVMRVLGMDPDDSEVR